MSDKPNSVSAESIQKIFTLPSPLSARDKKLKRYMWWLGKYHNFHNGLWLTAISAMIAVILMGLNFNRAYGNPSQLFYIFGCLGIAGCICGIALAFNSLILKTPLPNPAAIEKIKNNSKHNLKRIFIFPVILLVIAVWLLVVTRGRAEYLSLIIAQLMPAIYGFVILMTFFLFIAVNIAVNRSLIKKVENRENSKAFTQALFNESYNEIQKKNKKYDDARTLKRINAGKLPKTPREYEKERTFINCCKISVCVILSATLFVLVAFIRPDTVSVKHAEKISVGDNMGYITRMLGDPYDKDDVTDQQGEIVGGTWKWCSNPKAKKLAAKNKQLEKLLNQLETADVDDSNILDKIEKLAEDIFNLELELNKTAADYIFVTYLNGKATNIDFEKNYKKGNITQKSIAKITYAYSQSNLYYEYAESATGKISEADESSYNINIRTYFTDGSFSNYVKSFTLNAQTEGEHTLVWTDEYGEHSFTFVLK